MRRAPRYVYWCPAGGHFMAYPGLPCVRRMPMCAMCKEYMVKYRLVRVGLIRHDGKSKKTC